MVRDVFPAEVSMSDGSVLTRVRVFVTSKRLIAWREIDKRELVKVLDEPIVSHDGTPDRSSPGEGMRITIDLGTRTAIVNKGAGCGCGSALKALSTPIPWVRSMR